MRQLYGSDAKNALKARATDYIARLGKIPGNLMSGPIDLSVNKSNALGAFYEAGAICSRFYELGKIPNDSVLEAELHELIELYFCLVTKELTPNSVSAIEDDEQNLSIEDLTKLREHKRIERNRKLSESAKKFMDTNAKRVGSIFRKNMESLVKAILKPTI